MARDNVKYPIVPVKKVDWNFARGFWTPPEDCQKVTLGIDMPMEELRNPKTDQWYSVQIIYSSIENAMLTKVSKVGNNNKSLPEK